MNNLENFDIQRVKRSEIVLAGYNPRTITATARKLLKDGLLRFGQLTPLVWNRATKRLVGGHQRIALLDEENGWPKDDYELTVAAVELDEAGEREVNVLLNNVSAQGDWDFDQLKALVAFDGVDTTHLGFDDGEYEELMAEYDSAFQDESDQAPPSSQPPPAGEFHIVLLFNSESERDEVLAQVGSDKAKLDGRTFIEKIQ